MQKHTLFPTTVLQDHRPEFLDGMRMFVDAFRGDCSINEDILEGVEPGQTIHDSHHNVHYIDAYVPEFKKYIEKIALQYAKETFRMYPNDSVALRYIWPMVYKYNDTFFPHQHLYDNIRITGVYYVNVPVDSAPIRFYSNDSFMGDYSRIDTKYDIFPSTGDVLLYPANLIHGVPANLSTTERHTVAFDINLIRVPL